MNEAAYCSLLFATSYDANSTILALDVATLSGPERRSVVPSILHSGEGVNIVPGTGTLTCDVRASHIGAFDAVLESVPSELGEVALDARIGRSWPGMDATAQAVPLLARASALLGREIVSP